MFVPRPISFLKSILKDVTLKAIGDLNYALKPVMKCLTLTFLLSAPLKEIHLGCWSHLFIKELLNYSPGINIRRLIVLKTKVARKGPKTTKSLEFSPKRDFF